MKPQSDDEIIAVLKRVYPRTMKSADKRVCPPEDDLASFAEGGLKGRKQEKLISHLAFCKRCLDTVKFLRQKPVAEDVLVPAWLQNRVKDMVPEKPKTFEIVVTTVKEALQVLSTTAREFFGVPEFELPRPEMAIVLRNVSLRNFDAESRLDTLSEEFDLLPQGVSRISHQAIKDRKIPLASVESPKRTRLKMPRKERAKRFVFHETLGAFEVYVTIDRAIMQPDAFEIRVWVRDLSGKPAEDVEVAFMEGRKVVSKFTTQKDAGISKTLKPGQYHIRFNFKELHLGQAALDLRKEEQK